MDPDAALANARAAVARIDALEEEGAEAGQNDLEAIWAASVEATEHYRALDEWLSKGGFRPKAWERSQPCHG